MLDRLQSALHTYWPKFSWKMFWLLSHAKLMTLTLLVILAVLALASGARYRRRMVGIGLGLLAAYWFVISPLFAVPAVHLLTRFVPPDTGAPADAVVVLARSSVVQGDRYDTAVAMLAQGRVPQLLIMGKAQGGYVLQQMEQANLSVEPLTSAVCLRTTLDEAYSAGVFLGQRGAQRIILITDAPHMLRSWQTFEGLGFDVIPHIEPIPAGTSSQKRSFLAIREYFGLISYGLLGRLEDRSSQELSQLAQTLAQDYPPSCFLSADQLRTAVAGR